jgi:hypothetical protein
VVYRTGVLECTKSSEPITLPEVNTESEAEDGIMTVTNQKLNGTSQVGNNGDNNGGVHPGSCNIIEQSFQRMDLESLANIILLMEPVTTALENTSQTIRLVPTH